MYILTGLTRTKIKDGYLVVPRDNLSQKIIGIKKKQNASLSGKTITEFDVINKRSFFPKAEK